MNVFRRDFLKLAGTGAAGATAGISLGAQAQTVIIPGAGTSAVFDVKAYGARGDGASIDTPAINKAIEAASAQGGGTVRFPSGTTLLLYPLQEQCRAVPRNRSNDPGSEVAPGGAPAAHATIRRERINPGKIIRIMATIIGTIA